MSEVYTMPTQDSGAALFKRGIEGELVMLNMLRFREVADYSQTPKLDPGKEIPGREAFELYIEQARPLVEACGGEILFIGEGGSFFIGPEDEHWELIMLIKQRSLTDFMSFATNEAYQTVLGHRIAAVADSRLLPMEPRK
ncbi:hypothetical protein KS4_36320 [Poriferisphaera corsica]|uniref:DUF1330 domain-containing protein n=1 Tax=Poriferisphaera corsica TaxID=2528020 RepID=A0A517YZC4_9BACT|nr:DUF1330 domain-containing protein [Poriferisphaera corsica]QDU35549.1 hypothetical protein KS4_36320 [Poriferisphaera corsica]